VARKCEPALYSGLDPCFPAWSFTQNLLAFQSLFGVCSAVGALWGLLSNCSVLSWFLWKTLFRSWLRTYNSFLDVPVLLAMNFLIAWNCFGFGGWFVCILLHSELFSLLLPGIDVWFGFLGYRLFFPAVGNVPCYCYSAKVILNDSSYVHRFRRNDSIGYSFR